VEPEGLVPERVPIMFLLFSLVVFVAVVVVQFQADKDLKVVA
jgi:hypothetical protein